jgi:hypothetical protein
VSTQHLYTADDAGAINCDRVAPKLYERFKNIPSEPKNIFTVIDIFPSRKDVRLATLSMQDKGLHPSQIVIISKKYQEHQDSMNWEYISSDGGLAGILTELGIDAYDTPKFVDAVEAGKLLLVAIVTDRSAIEAQHILEDVGHKVIHVY